jgi:ureidoglycolate lyase
MPALRLTAEPLSRDAFAPFGDVIDTEGAHHYPINEGTTERYHDLARIDIGPGDGRPLVNIFRATPVTPPVRLRVMERHPLASQAFVPLSARPFLVVVSPADAPPSPELLRGFLTRPGQGVNYRPGVWHHPLLALEAVSDFVVIDRGGPGHNCDEVHLEQAVELALPA